MKTTQYLTLERRIAIGDRGGILDRWRYGRPTRTTCYWFRLRDTSGEGPSIASDGTRGPATVTIKKSDAAFRTSGCSTWQKVR